MQPQPSIQMTLFDYFMDQEQFTLNEAVEAVKQVKEVKEPSVRGRIYEGIDKGLFVRVGKGVYTVKRNDQTCLLINGDGRDLSMFEDNSFDALITDHPYKLDKSLKGGNRDFASYESFQYEQKDMDEKFRVLKNGCFLVELLPEENSDNYKYIFKIKEMAENAGFEYFSTVPWKKGDFVANTGRKAKNTENVVMFTKGKCRDLRLDAKKNKAMINDMSVICFKEYWNDVSTPVYKEEPDVIELKLLVSKDSQKEVETELREAFDNWMYSECENSILIEDELDNSVLCQVPICDYMMMWLQKKGYEYTDITDVSKNIDFETVSESAFVGKITEILKDIAPEKLHYMSGAKGMLPTVFDVQPPSKAERIHQAEKPVELMEQIIEFVTQPNEKILDPFAGSGVLGEAALNTGRDSVLIEKDEETYEKAVERINKRRGR